MGSVGSVGCVGRVLLRVLALKVLNEGYINIRVNSNVKKLKC